LIALRRYALAADVLASAVAGAANPAVVTNLIEMLRKTRRVEELSQTIRQPEDAVRTLLTRAWLYEEHEADWIEPFSTFMVDGEDPDQFKTLAHIMASQKGKLRASGVTAEAALDLALSGTQFVREGSDENGWVVRMMTPGNGAATPQQQVFFVMRQDETYRILAANGDFAGVARLALRLVEQGSVQQAAIWLDRVRGELSAGNSDDSLSGHMFSRVWQKGVASDANRVRIAAALLLSDKPKEVAGVITMLEGALKSGADGTANAISASLAEAYSMDKQYAAALRINERLMEELPHSATALRLAFQSAYAAGGKSEADRILTAHIGAFKEDPDALRGVASVAMVFGDPDKATAIEQQIVDSGRAFAGDYNQIAWAALMADKVTAATIDIANRGVLMGGNGTTSLLHTLAAVEAELDKAGDARAMLLQRMKDLGEDEPDDDDWYVFGRIAESYGLRGDAVTMYRRLQRPKTERAIPSSSYALAQRRLKLMAASK
jgi:tetratricopeptide (TPR) repeat protein